MHFLDFEKPVKDLYDKLQKAIETAEESNTEANIAQVDSLKKQFEESKQMVYSNLTPWQKVQMSRHPDRPQFLDYVSGIFENFVELHGDRKNRDDRSIIGGLAELNGKSVVVIGIQKGKTTREKQVHNFGMAGPEGYRKALRLMQLAEKYNKPVITFIDTPGASSAIEAEVHGMAEAIAQCINQMVGLKVPTISVIIGEAAGGGALALAVADKVLMLEYTWYSVISPETCANALWHNWTFTKEATEQLKLTASHLLNFNLIDGIISEPCCGAHHEPVKTIAAVKQDIYRELKKLEAVPVEKLLVKRSEKLVQMGDFEEISEN